MGSEGQKSVNGKENKKGSKYMTIVHVTGFKEFQGVAQNPTQIIVNSLKDYVEKRRLPADVTLGTCTVLETAGESAISTLLNVIESGSSSVNSSNSGQVIWLHLGVNTGGTNFEIERQAANEATFPCPDELGWQPQQLPIVHEDGEITRTRKTSCSPEAIVQVLKKNGFEVTISDDAGLFVCNYVYYHSLRMAEQKGHKSLFVHVPTFKRINKETQMEFIVALLEAIASTCRCQ